MSKPKKSYEEIPENVENVENHKNQLNSFDLSGLQPKTGNSSGSGSGYNSEIGNLINSGKGCSVMEAQKLLGTNDTTARTALRKAWRNARKSGYIGLAIPNTDQAQRYFNVPENQEQDFINLVREQGKGYTVKRDKKSL